MQRQITLQNKFSESSQDDRHFCVGSSVLKDWRKCVGEGNIIEINEIFGVVLRLYDINFVLRVWMVESGEIDGRPRHNLGYFLAQMKKSWKVCSNNMDLHSGYSPTQRNIYFIPAKLLTCTSQNVGILSPVQ